MAAAAEVDSFFRHEPLWDELLGNLQSSGVAVLDNVSEDLADIHRHGFQVANDALNHIQCVRAKRDVDVTSCVPWIHPGADSAHATGYHPSNDLMSGMSRYNTNREGFVFSDNSLFDVEGISDFQPAMKLFFNSLHAIANCVLQSMDRHLNLPTGWLQDNLGPTNEHSQWHIKRYVAHRNETTDTTVLLPVHTDPSLFSIVVHNRPGKNHGAMGLEYQHKGAWIPVPWHGHQVATIFVGSVWSYLTGGKWPAAMHRVIQVKDRKYEQFFLGPNAQTQRMAATLFVRPRRTALLCVPPSPHLAGVLLKRQISFETWSAKVARNYEKKKNADASK